MKRKKNEENFGYPAFLDIGDIELPSINFNQLSLEHDYHERPIRKFANKRFRQKKDLGQDSLNPEEDYNFAQGRDLLGQYFL